MGALRGIVTRLTECRLGLRLYIIIHTNIVIYVVVVIVIHIVVVAAAAEL